MEKKIAIINSCRISKLLIGLFFISSPVCYAYVDPGLLGGGIQILYAFVMGFISLYIFRPIQFVQNLLFH